MKSSSYGSENAKMEKQSGEGARPGDAKIALACRRKFNFEDIAKQHDFLKKSEFAVSSRPEGQNGEEDGETRPHLGRPKSRSRVSESAISKILQNNVIF